MQRFFIFKFIWGLCLNADVKCTVPQMMLKILVLYSHFMLNYGGTRGEILIYRKLFHHD